MTSGAPDDTVSDWLRHDPEAGGLTLDPQGWTDVDAVLAAFARERMACDWLDLLRVVRELGQAALELSGDTGHGSGHGRDIRWKLRSTGRGSRRRPCSITVRSPSSCPRDPDAEGLKPMRRHHVHLSQSIDTATRVGLRRGAPVILAALRCRSAAAWLASS